MLPSARKTGAYRLRTPPPGTTKGAAGTCAGRLRAGVAGLGIGVAGRVHENDAETVIAGRGGRGATASRGQRRGKEEEKSEDREEWSADEHARQVRCEA